MSARLEFACEQLCIELMQRSSVLSGMTFRHWDEDKDSATECIVVRATAGEKQYAGPGGHPVEVEATYRTAQSEAGRNEAIIEAMTNSVYKASRSVRVPAYDLFRFLSIEDGGGNDRENTRNLRKRSRTFSFIAKEKA